MWEIAGTAHADNYTIQVAPIDTGSAALTDIVAAYAPTNMLMGQQLDHCINFAPQHHYVLQAALSQLRDWVRTGQPPPSGAPIECDGEPACSRCVRPREGRRQDTVGGCADCPTSGDGGDESPMSSIFGSGELFDAATVRRLYPGGVRIIWSASPRPWTRRSRRASSWRLIARRFCNWPPRRFPASDDLERSSLEGQAEQGVRHAEQKVQRDKHQADEEQRAGAAALQPPDRALNCSRLSCVAINAKWKSATSAWATGDPPASAGAGQVGS